MSALTTPVTSPSAAPAAPGVIGRQAAARIAGVGYVLLFGLAIFANFMVLEGLVVDGDATTTVANLTASMGMFRLGLVAFLMVAVIDVVIAWALFVVLREVHRDLALLAAWSRLVYTVFLGVALVYFFQVIVLLTDAGIGAAMGPDAIGAQVMLALGSFDAAWLVGLTVFGVHLVLLGVLLMRGQLVPRVLGVLLIVAGVALRGGHSGARVAPGLRGRRERLPRRRRPPVDDRRGMARTVAPPDASVRKDPFRGHTGRVSSAS